MDKVELCYTPASELARLIAAKDVSPVEVMEVVLERLRSEGRSRPAAGDGGG